MKRTMLLALVAALALTVGLNATAVASDAGADAQATAKKDNKGAKKKGSACKAKGKAKGKAKAKGKGRAAEKGAGCKSKGKGKSKRKAPKAPAATFGPGKYEDTDSGVEINVVGRQAHMQFVIPESGCLSGIGMMDDAPFTVSGQVVKASNDIGTGGGVTVKWALTVNLPSLSYRLVVESATNFSDEDPCSKAGTFKGKLTKG